MSSMQAKILTVLQNNLNQEQWDQKAILDYVSVSQLFSFYFFIGGNKIRSILCSWFIQSRSSQNNKYYKLMTEKYLFHIIKKQ